MRATPISHYGNAAQSISENKSEEASKVLNSNIHSVMTAINAASLNRTPNKHVQRERKSLDALFSLVGEMMLKNAECLSSQGKYREAVEVVENAERYFTSDDGRIRALLLEIDDNERRRLQNMDRANLILDL